MSGLLPKHVHEYLGALQDASLAIKSAGSQSVGFLGTVYSDCFTIEAGRKYLKVVVTHTSTNHSTDEMVLGQRSVHAFIDKHTGDLLKAAGWNQPQRDKDGLAVRGNLVDDGWRALLCKTLRAEPGLVHGGYLYKRDVGL